jgi:glycosyltransferase involved in cell wall biosynthesis
MACGEAANTYHLLRHLAGPGLDLHLLTTDAGERPTLPGVAIHPRMRTWSWAELPAFVRFLRNNRPDAVLLMYLGGIYGFRTMITFAPTIVKRVLPGTRVVTRFENPMSPARPGATLASRIARRLAALWAGPGCAYLSGTLLRDSDRVIVLCRRHATVLREEDPAVAERTDLIPPPSNVPLPNDPDGARRAAGRAALRTSSDTFVLGYLGYVYRYKGVETLLAALADLRARGRDARLVVLGGDVEIAGQHRTSSYLDSLRTMAARLGLQEYVHWTGAFAEIEAQTAALMHAVDAFVLPFDNGVRLNNSSVTSLATHGFPMILTVSDDTDPEFVDGENALLCPARDPSAIAAAVVRLWEDPALCQRLRDGARHLAATRLSWPVAVARTLATLGTRSVETTVSVRA